MSDDGYEKRFGLADMHGTVVLIRVDSENNPPGQSITLEMKTGAGSIWAELAPEIARQLAAALLDAAEAGDSVSV